MKKSLAAACLLVLAHSLPALAQDANPNLPPPVVAVSKVLQLTDAQVQSLVTMIGSRDATLRPLFEQVQQHQAAIDSLLQKADADPATLGGLILEMRTLKMNIEAIGRQASAQFEQVLTPDQLDRLQHIRAVAPVAEVLPAFRAVGLI